MNKIALYPSSVHLLPGGRASYTLIEKRHLRMLKESLATNTPFAICMINESEEDSELKHIPAIATECKVVNFDQAEANLLSVVVEGTQKIRLHGISLDEDGLMQGESTYTQTGILRKSGTVMKSLQKNSNCFSILCLKSERYTLHHIGTI